MFLNFLRAIRYQTFRLIRLFAPKGSAIDTILDSYTDWHDEQKQSVTAVDQRPRVL